VDAVVGPVELAVLAFPGSQFRGEIIPALADLVDGGVVSILDLAIVSKEDSGDTMAIELVDLDEEARAAFADLDGEIRGLLSEEDLQSAAEALEPGNTAAVIVWENAWARRLIGAIQDAGGFLVAHDRLDAETVQAALAASSEQEE
jgi:hypothetical protein